MRMTRVALVLTCAMALTAATMGSAQARPPGPPSVEVAVSPQSGTVETTPCGLLRLDVGMTNDRDRAVYTDVRLHADPALHLPEPVVSSWIPAHQTVTTSVPIKPAGDAAPGAYHVTIDGGRRPVTVPVAVQEPETHGDLARNATPTASSSHGGFTPCMAVDGNLDQSDWAQTTGWNDGTSHQFPDWLQVKFAAPHQVDKVVVVTRDTDAKPASVKGVRDYDIQALVDGEWATIGTVRGNTAEVITTTVGPVTTDTVRIVISDTNDHKYSRVLELEVYGDG